MEKGIHDRLRERPQDNVVIGCCRFNLILTWLSRQAGKEDRRRIAAARRRHPDACGLGGVLPNFPPSVLPHSGSDARCQDLHHQRAGAFAFAVGDAAHHLYRAGALGQHRHSDRFPVRAEPDHRAQLLSLRRHPPGDADRGDCPAHHYSCQEHPGRAGHLRHHHRHLSGHLEHHRGSAQQSTLGIATCSLSTGPRGCKILSICGFRARCPISSPAYEYRADLL